MQWLISSACDATAMLGDLCGNRSAAETKGWALKLLNEVSTTLTIQDVYTDPNLFSCFKM